MLFAQKTTTASPSTPHTSPPLNPLDVFEHVKANADVHHQGYERRKLRRDGDTSDGDNIIGDILREGQSLFPWMVMAASDLWHDSSLRRTTTTAAYFPSRPTACEYHVCTNLTSNSAGHCPSRFHPVEAAPNNTAFFRTFLHCTNQPHTNFFSRRWDFALLKLSRSTSGTHKLGRHNNHHIPIHKFMQATTDPS